MTKKQLSVAFLILMVGFGLLLVIGNLEDEREVDKMEMTEPQYLINFDSMLEETESGLTIEETSGHKDEVLTIDNCEDLENLLALKDPFDSSVSEFAENYKGRVIEFDAYVAYLANHGDYNTRYDILIYAGDYSENGSSGPSFQFEDVGVFDLGQSGLYLPDFICAGRNVHVIAKVEEFDSNAGLFKLDPISVEDR